MDMVRAGLVALPGVCRVWAFLSLYFSISVGFSSGRVCVRRSSGEEEMPRRRGDFGERTNCDHDEHADCVCGLRLGAFFFLLFLLSVFLCPHFE